MSSPTPSCSPSPLHGSIVVALLVLAAAAPSRASAQRPAPPPPSPSRIPRTATPTALPDIPRPPAATPGGPDNAEPLVGPLPQCSVQADLRTEPATVVVGAAVTATLDVTVACPDMLHDRGVVLVLGALPSPASLPHVREALGSLVRTLAAGTGNRVSVVDAADPSGDEPWHRDAASLAALADRMETVPLRPAVPFVAWSAALDRAAARLGDLTSRERPFLVVIDGAGSDDEAADRTIAERVEAMATWSVDAAGHALLLDLTPTRRLFRRIAGSGRPFLVAFPETSAQADVREVVGTVLATFGAPLLRVAALLAIDPLIRTGTCVPIDTYPAATWSSPLQAEWFVPAGGHTTRWTSSTVMRAEQPMSPVRLESLVLVEREGVPNFQAGSASTVLCVMRPGDGGCPLPEPTPRMHDPTATPRACPARAVAWLPSVLNHAGGAPGTGVAPRRRYAPTTPR